MKKLIMALMTDPICNGIMSLLTYIFYGAVLGVSLVPSVLFGIKMYELIPLDMNFYLRILLYCISLGVAFHIFLISSLIAFGIVERILTLGFKPGRYSTSSFTFGRWIIYSGLHVILMNLVLPYVSGTVWNKMFYKILGAKLGKNVFINSPKLSDAYLLTLGDNVVIGGGSSVSCHIFEGDKLILGEIKVGNNVLIGADTYVMPGATIGDNCNIGLKATVRKNKKIPEKSIIMAFPGTPAKKIAELLKDDSKEE